jgi:hypothetical protein
MILIVAACLLYKPSNKKEGAESLGESQEDGQLEDGGTGQPDDSVTTPIR